MKMCSFILSIMFFISTTLSSVTWSRHLDYDYDFDLSYGIGKYHLISGNHQYCLPLIEISYSHKNPSWRTLHMNIKKEENSNFLYPMTFKKINGPSFRSGALGKYQDAKSVLTSENEISHLVRYCKGRSFRSAHKCADWEIYFKIKLLRDRLQLLNAYRQELFCEYEKAL